MTHRDHVSVGREALARGDWSTARAEFEAAWAAEGSPADALDGLARALWWTDDPATALEVRARAFAALRREHRHREAAGVAVWLARQHLGLYQNRVVAEGWLSRARSLIARLEEPGSLPGWLALAESELGQFSPAATRDAGRAVTVARQFEDVDLEIVALARCGAVTVARGDVAPGLSALHEAMAGATSGEGVDVQYLGEVLCTLLEVSGWLGDPGTAQPWAQMLSEFGTRYTFGALIPFRTSSPTELLAAFCTGCCGGVYLVTGRLDAAEEQLTRASRELIDSGRRPRCLHPVAQLAELRVTQGRLEEADALLTGFETDPECAPILASLHLALGQPGQALATLTAALDAVAHTPVLALPLLAELVEAALAAGDRALATEAARRIDSVATTTGTTLHLALSDVAHGRLAQAANDGGAASALRRAALRFAEAGASLPACRARLALARSLASTDRGLAVTEARSALNSFERLGAIADADRAAAFLRELGVRGRTGRRDVGVLTRREQEVLRLVAEGLSNPEIAERLFISGKTAGHHVSSILMKLGLRSRTEAAAFALLNIPRTPTPTPAATPTAGRTFDHE